MQEITSYKKKIIANFVILLLISVITVIVTIGASKGFKNQTGSILLLFLFLIQIPVILNLGFNGLKAVNFILEAEQNRNLSKADELEVLEKAVEEKAKEADDLAFSNSMFLDELQNDGDWNTFAQSVLIGFSKQIEVVVGIFYQFNPAKQKFNSIATYAYYSEYQPNEFSIGDGLSGQVAKDNKAMFLSEIPEGFVKVMSGLGAHKPKYLAILPVTFQNQVIGLIELATFVPVERGLAHKANEIAELIGKKASVIKA